ncbi:hypothetical protein AVEN_262438-1 [Araneus ventricosus]|uniref:RNase H type-1 domain-containing protein n=1 Tax=Araneus ventricosus TaxID=182803 RepID=A0A4Y2RG48_ARAVE|nr:hypothetical protein AVEN_262438-1 [Araneus ventricosus]
MNAFLLERAILLSRDDSSNYNVGVPQCSSLGPVLWLLVINEVLNMTDIKQEAYIQAYVDDLVILLRTTASYRFKEMNGSKIGDRVGAFFVHYANKQEITISQYRLADHNTVYVAEVFAIHKTIEYIPDHELYDVKIVSDSRSALMTVESLSHNREFIWQIKKRLKDGEYVKLMWEMGNERADLLANEASNRDLIDVQFTYTKVQIRNINNKKKLAEKQKIGSAAGYILKMENGQG